MQQPISQQHDQLGGQQALSQPMVLCPVRFVYETQILVQPGDHIQPNQTFFINAQNPPPWMQNSLQTRQAISSPVVYVQHVPNNIVSSVQQPMDQNQLYLQQNFANFQMQQQMLAQNQDMRQTMQLANIVPNMVQNIQTNVANDRSGPHNSQMQQTGQLIQAQINRPVQNQMNQMEVSRQVMMRPQMHQQTNTPRPVMTMNQMQSMQQQTVPNIVQNVNHAMSNMVRPSPNMNMVRAPAPNNIVSIQPLSKVRENALSDANKTTNNSLTNVVPNPRNFVPNYYRPIQPRPQTSHNVPNMPKSQQHIPVQTLQSAPVYNNDRNNSQQNTSNNYTIVQQLNNPANRKRKSESPDEIQNKITISGPKHNQSFMTITKIVNEIGTNTSPVHRPRVNTQNKMNNIPVTNIRSCGSIIENMIKEAMMPDKDKLIRNTVYTQARGRVLQDKVEEIKPHSENRSEPINIVENRVVEVVQMETRDETKTVDINKSVQTIESVANIENNIKVETRQTDFKDDTNSDNIVETNVNNNINNTIENKPHNFKENIEVTDDSKHIEIVVNYIKKSEVAIPPIKDKVEEVKKEPPNNNDDHNNKKEDKIKNDTKEANNKTIKQENINILTHVVDGYVIQESNVAFPIRKPLKEKTLHTNTKPEQGEEKDLIRESIKEELKNNVDIPLLPFHYLMLDSAREEKEKAEEKKAAEKKAEDMRVAEKRAAEKKAEDKMLEEKKKVEDDRKKAEEIKMDVDITEDQPFLQLQHSTVKNWTVADVCNHLLKFNWKETVSLFHDHEIDGESLLLVSKQQLITIGVKEDHADIICDFVKG